MSRERFRQTGERSFFGQLVYERAVPQGHFLRKLRELLPWESLTEEWVALYKGGAEYGPPPYHPSLVLKMTPIGPRRRMDTNRGGLALEQDPDYQAGLQERYKIEQKFGEAKLLHGFGRCRYLGLDRYSLQAYLTALVLNLKRMVKLLWGVGFRQPPKAALQAA